MGDPDRHPSDEELLALAQGELSPQRGERLRIHLDACQKCRENYRVWRDIHRQLSELPSVSIPETVDARVERLVQEPRRDKDMARPSTPVPTPKRIDLPKKAVQSAGLFRGIQGRPVIIRGQTTQVPTVGTRLIPGDEIRTGETDRALIRLPDSGQIVVGFDSSALISAGLQSEKESTTTMELVRGNLWVWSPGDGREICIESRKGIGRVYHGEALVRHHEPLTTANWQRDAVIEVLAFSGQVSFLDPRGRLVEIPLSHAIRAGQRTEIISAEEQPLVRILRLSSTWGTLYEAWQMPPLTAVDLLTQLDVPRVSLGAKLKPTLQPQQGLQVASIEPGSNAEQAGLRAGDNVLCVGQLPIVTATDVAASELLLAGQTERTITVGRGDTHLTLSLPRAATPPRLCDSANAHLSAIAVLTARADIGRAEQECMQITKEQPTCGSGWFNLGLLQEYQGRCSEALASYKKARQMSPESAEVHLALGRVYARDANGRRAAVAMARAVSIKSTGLGHYLLGKVLLLDGRLEQAQEQTQLLLTSSSAEDRAWGHSLAGQTAYIVDSDLSQVSLHWAEASVLDPANIEVTYYMAVAKWNMGNTTEAKQLLKALLQAQPDFIGATSLMGVIASGEQNWQEARQWFEKGRALAPESPVFPYNLGKVALATGDPAAAAIYYRQSIRKDPSFTVAYIGLGVALDRAGRWEMAAELYQEALELDPGNTDALDRLVALWNRHDQPERARHLGRRYDLMSAASG